MVNELWIGSGGEAAGVYAFNLESRVSARRGTFADRSPGLGVYAVAVDVDRAWIVAGTKRGRVHAGASLSIVRAWRIADGSLAWEYTLVGRGVTALGISPSGEIIVGCDDGATVESMAQAMRRQLGKD